MSIIGVIGGNNQHPNVISDATQIGLLLAKAGYTVMTGGDGSANGRAKNVKDAAIAGCLAGGGKAIGIVPKAAADKVVLEGNLLLVHTTLSPLGRDLITGAAPDALIVLPGGDGTKTELAFGSAFGKPIFVFSGAVAQLQAAEANYDDGLKACLLFGLTEPTNAQLDAAAAAALAKPGFKTPASIMNAVGRGFPDESVFSKYFGFPTFR